MLHAVRLPFASCFPVGRLQPERETQPAARMMLDVPGVLFVHLYVCVKNSKGSVSDSNPLLYNRYTLGCVFICIKGLFHDRSQ